MGELKDEMNEEQNSSLNNYEKVIIAARRARQINNHRLAEKEQMAPEELAQLVQSKVTSIALDELEENKVEFERATTNSDEETYDLT
jgi:DNA-directed RNA polymerase omega subunit